MELEKFLSELDTERFGFKVAKINEYLYNPKEILIFLKENDIKLVLSKIGTENMELINELEKLGFYIKDIQVTYKYGLKDYEINNNLGDINFFIRDAQLGDVQQLEKIAIDSFKNYGHYYADKKLDQQKCDEIYGNWIKRSLEEKVVADKILLAEFNENIVGFLSFKIYKSNNFKYAAGGLGAVSPNYRNKNIFKMLTLAGLNWGKEKELDWEEHNVLITNYPVNRSFSKLGFKIFKSFVTMHHWID